MQLINSNHLQTQRIHKKNRIGTNPEEAKGVNCIASFDTTTREGEGISRYSLISSLTSLSFSLLLSFTLFFSFIFFLFFLLVYFFICFISLVNPLATDEILRTFLLMFVAHPFFKKKKIKNKNKKKWKKELKQA